MLTVIRRELSWKIPSHVDWPDKVAHNELKGRGLNASVPAVAAEGTAQNSARGTLANTMGVDDVHSIAKRLLDQQWLAQPIARRPTYPLRYPPNHARSNHVVDAPSLAGGSDPNPSWVTQHIVSDCCRTAATQVGADARVSTDRLTGLIQ